MNECVNRFAWGPHAANIHMESVFQFLANVRSFTMVKELKYVSIHISFKVREREKNALILLHIQIHRTHQKRAKKGVECQQNDGTVSLILLLMLYSFKYVEF